MIVPGPLLCREICEIDIYPHGVYNVRNEKSQ